MFIDKRKGEGDEKRKKNVDDWNWISFRFLSSSCVLLFSAVIVDTLCLPPVNFVSLERKKISSSLLLIRENSRNYPLTQESFVQQRCKKSPQMWNNENITIHSSVCNEFLLCSACNCEQRGFTFDTHATSSLEYSKMHNSCERGNSTDIVAVVVWLRLRCKKGSEKHWKNIPKSKHRRSFARHKLEIKFCAIIHFIRFPQFKRVGRIFWSVPCF